MPCAELVQEWATEPTDVQEWPKAEGDQLRWAGASERTVDPYAISVSALESEIKRAEQILDLAKDWDGEGAPGYSGDTLDRAAAFLKAHLKGIWDRDGIIVSVPQIGPGPEGSIDLHWRKPSWELLVNIPADPSAMAAFYGDNYGVQTIKGSLDPKTFNMGIATWLMA